ncbi:hypothetical protein [Streptomyces sp. TRM68416]|uniref:hypothetical protein n=1 Tax=Streptomyces sp. TRM68416 TaxID=2758412 RepID=UPI001661B203|nr:hypothetical protein [Streptomyces sp. TRM68416]MBD0842750.1 hypothetical protein [Streptomyces sp. TRM68416]
MEVKRRRGLDTTRPPAWLSRLELGMPPRRLYALSGAFAVLTGAMISTVISQWLVLPGILLALGLLWFIAVNTDQRLWLMAPFLFATFALIVFGMFIDQDRALAERGRPVDLVVVERSQTRSESTCKVRFPDGSVSEGPIGGCRGADVGESIRLFVDPEGEVQPSNTTPNVALWTWLAAGTNLIFTACVVRSAVRGVRRLRELQTAEQFAPLRGLVPPPPPPSSPPPLHG